jgi:hypothetical protein
MVQTVKCPKCSNFCDFGDGKLFGFCSKCGSRLERTLQGKVSVYVPDDDSEPLVSSCRERFEVCTKIIPPTRADHDVEGFEAAIEMMMDQLMSFTETQKDILAAVAEFPAERRLRTIELCSDMSFRIEKQFADVLDEYQDNGMQAEFRKVNAEYAAQLQSLSGKLFADQKSRADTYWSKHKEEHDELEKRLNDARSRRAHLPFFDFQGKWACDAEIAEIQEKLNNVPN